MEKWIAIGWLSIAALSCLFSGLVILDAVATNRRVNRYIRSRERHMLEIRGYPFMTALERSQADTICKLLKKVELK